METLILVIIALALFSRIIYRTLFYNKHTNINLNGLQHPKTTVVRDFTLGNLAEYNGVKNEQIYMAVKDKVFDVTDGKRFYGPGGPYENFAGRDASVGLAKQSFDMEFMNSQADLSKSELANLKNWYDRLSEKYPCVGRLV